MQKHRNLGELKISCTNIFWNRIKDPKINQNIYEHLFLFVRKVAVIKTKHQPTEWEQIITNYQAMTGRMQNVQPQWKSMWWYLKNMGMNLLQNSALYPIYPKDTSSYTRDFYSTMLNAIQFTITRNWKQPRYPSTDEWIRKIFRQ